jgi:hypothetical protein
MKEGAGKLYDKETGNIVYEGEFKMDRKNGNGIEFDAYTGRKTGEGEFYDDVLVDGIVYVYDEEETDE